MHCLVRDVIVSISSFIEGMMNPYQTIVIVQTVPSETNGSEK